jgi:hypothetical protein
MVLSLNSSNETDFLAQRLPPLEQIIEKKEMNEVEANYSK